MIFQLNLCSAKKLKGDIDMPAEDKNKWKYIHIHIHIFNILNYLMVKYNICSFRLIMKQVFGIEIQTRLPRMVFNTKPTKLVLNYIYFKA